MTPLKMKRLLTDRLQRKDWEIKDLHEQEELRIEDKATKKGITIGLSGIVSKYEQSGETAIEDVVYHVEEALKVMTETQHLEGKEQFIFPVIRSASFPEETKDGRKLVFDEHTAETRVYYALDLGKAYRLLDEDFLQKEGWQAERIREVARFNVRSLESKLKQDQVAGNRFYFLNTNDGYDASRILNEALLEKMAASAEGTLTISVPHQDVLIISDIVNDRGYDILAEMAMKFFAEGRVPITALSFIYEQKKLEPIFIVK